MVLKSQKGDEKMDLEELEEFEEFEASLRVAIEDAPNSYYKDALEETLREVKQEIEDASQELAKEKEAEVRELEREYWNSQF